MPGETSAHDQPDLRRRRVFRGQVSRATPRVSCRSKRATRPTRRGCRRSPPRCATPRPRTSSREPTVRSGCAGSRPRSRSTCAATPRSRARTCSTRPAASRPTPRPCSTPGAACSARHARPTARSASTSPPRRPNRATRPPGCSTRSASTKAESLRTDGQFFMLVVPDAATVRDLSPDFRALRALTDVRGVYVTAPGDDGEFDIVSRCFAPKVGIDEDPVTGSMHCVLAPYWCERLGKTELHAHQASARGGVDARAPRRRSRAADRPRGHDAAGRAARLTRRAVPGDLRRDPVAERAPAATSRAARAPGRSPRRCGTSRPACFGPGSTATGAPATSPTSAMRSLSVISAPPARFTIRAGRDVAVGRREVARHDVAHVGELADLRAVAVARERGAVDRGLAQPVDRHVGPLPRAEHREVPQRRPCARPSSRRTGRRGARPRASSRRRG